MLTPQDRIKELIAVFNGIDSLRGTFRDRTRINGIITHGGTASNVIPDYARGEFTIRADTMKYLEYVIEKVKVVIKNAELLTGAEASIDMDPIYAERYPNMIMEEAFKANMELLGEKMVYPDKNERVGSSDIGNVSLKIPTSHPYLKIVEPHILTHTKEFAEAAISERGNEVVIKAAKALAMTGYDILNDDKLRQSINNEFKTNVLENLEIQG
jgi:metal-dependent amidase/aminoacylase/carboxypeptidase family protein